MWKANQIFQGILNGTMINVKVLAEPHRVHYEWKLLNYVGKKIIFEDIGNDSNRRGNKYSRGDNAHAILSSISIGKTHESCMSRRKTVVHCSSILL